MTEVTFSAAIRRAARGLGYYPIKHADRATLNLPDHSINGAGRTVWLELKYLRRHDQIWDVVEPGQLETLRRLLSTCGHAAIAARRTTGEIDVYLPLPEYLHLRSQWAFPTWTFETERAMLRFLVEER